MKKGANYQHNMSQSLTEALAGSIADLGSPQKSPRLSNWLNSFLLFYPNRH